MTTRCSVKETLRSYTCNCLVWTWSSKWSTTGCGELHHLLVEFADSRWNWPHMPCNDSRVSKPTSPIKRQHCTNKGIVYIVGLAVPDMTLLRVSVGYFPILRSTISTQITRYQKRWKRLLSIKVKWKWDSFKQCCSPAFDGSKLTIFFVPGATSKKYPPWIYDLRDATLTQVRHLTENICLRRVQRRADNIYIRMMMMILSACCCRRYRYRPIGLVASIAKRVTKSISATH